MYLVLSTVCIFAHLIWGWVDQDMQPEVEESRYYLWLLLLAMTVVFASCEIGELQQEIRDLKAAPAEVAQ